MRVNSFEDMCQAWEATWEPLPPLPAGYPARRAWLAAARPALARVGCGVRLETIAAALQVSHQSVYRWERLEAPDKPRIRKSAGQRAFDGYCRIVAGMARHLEVSEL